MSKELIEQLRDLANCRHDDLSIGYEAAERIEQLEREIAELKADAMRYRWLRDNKAANNDHCWHFQTGPIIPALLVLDAAIDEMRKP